MLSADTMFIPDPILPWVESARLRKKGTGVLAPLGGGRGSRLAEMPRQRRVLVPNRPHHVIQRVQLTGAERFMHAVATRVGQPKKGQQDICPGFFRTR